MGVLTTGYTWPTSGQFTGAKVNQSVNDATFSSGAYDNSSVNLDGNGKLQVKDGGIAAQKLASSSVTPAKIAKTGNQFEFEDVTTTKATVTPVDIAQSTSTMSLDLDDGNIFDVTLTANVTTVSAVANMVDGKSFIIFIRPSGATRSITGWDSTWKFVGGFTPTITGTAGSIDVISGITDGTNMYVFSCLKNFS
jgi:hypothetical protein